ncbi:MAG: hypothetical protein ACR2IS_14480 [Nitrososphaeraceae archaeon]
MKDIAQGTNVKPKALSHSYRILLTELDIKTPMLDSMRCIVKVANKMHLNERMTRKGMDIMQTAIRKEASAGKHPMGLAAAVLDISQLDNKDVIFIQRVMKALITIIRIRIIIIIKGLKRHLLRQQE